MPEGIDAFVKLTRTAMGKCSIILDDTILRSGAGQWNDPEIVEAARALVAAAEKADS